MRNRAALLELARVVWPFVMSALLMGSLATVCFYVMSAGRAYVDGESLWSKSQKDALLYVERYVDTCDPLYLRRYQSAVAVPFGDRMARLAMERTPDAIEPVRQGFTQGLIHPDDIGGMRFVFRWLGWVPAIDRAVAAWRQADEKLLEIHATVQQLNTESAEFCSGRSANAQLLARVHRLNDELTPLQVAFSQHLGEANRLLFKIAVAAMVLGSLLLGAPGLWLSYRVVKSNLDALRRADEASRAKTEFLANMSHELRTPMNGVIGLIDALQQSGLDDEQRETTELMRSSGASLLALLEDVLDMSKIEAGQMRVDSVPVDSARVVEQVCGVFHPIGLERGVDLTFYTDPNIPVAILGDPLRLRQIITNLVCNAVKFSAGRPHRGEVHVRWTLHDGPEEAGSGPRLMLTVRDNGIGIAPDTRAALFQPFVQADLSTTRRFGGTGLGLAIIHHLLQAMGGVIEVDSTPGVGSTFKVSLPLHRASASPTTQTAPTAPALNDPRLATLSDQACVVVGAAESVTSDLGAYLAHAGAQVQTLTSPAQAMGHWEELSTAGRRLWLIDAPHEGLPEAERPHLVALKQALAGQRDALVLTLGRGAQRRLRPNDDGPGQCIDVNGMGRAAWLQTVMSVLAPAVRAPSAPAPEPAADVGSPPLCATASLAAASRQGAATRPAPTPRPERVLVAEDNPANQKVIAFQLKSLGFAPDLANDGQQALDLALVRPYDLVITDLHMPNMDGYQLTTELRRRDLRRGGAQRLPVIALTANAQSGEAERCNALGMDDFLTKPVTLPVLSSTIDKWLLATQSDSQESPCTP